MQPGVVFPQNEIGVDPADIRNYAQTVEGLGYNHVCINMIGAGFTSLQQHLEVIRRYKEAFGRLS